MVHMRATTRPLFHEKYLGTEGKAEDTAINLEQPVERKEKRFAHDGAHIPTRFRHLLSLRSPLADLVIGQLQSQGAPEWPSIGKQAPQKLCAAPIKQTATGQHGQDGQTEKGGHREEGFEIRTGPARQ